MSETPDQVQHMRYQNAALISMCNAYLGNVLDLMDQYDLWKDTLLIVNTDHGFLLGEHGWWAKCVQPFYNEVALSPLFIWDPRCGCQGERRTALVQTIDLPATLLEYFCVDRPPDMQGVPLGEIIASDLPVREAGLYGLHGGHVNVTDGRYVYMRAPVTPENVPLYNYTLMPTHMRQMFSVQELRDLELAAPFSFTKGCQLIKVKARGWPRAHPYQTMLFDLYDDPRQGRPIDDPALERMMIDHMIRLMRENDAPREQFERLGLSG